MLAVETPPIHFNLNRDRVHQNLRKNNQKKKPKSPKASIPICNAIAPEVSKLDFQLRRSSVARRLEFFEPKSPKASVPICNAIAPEAARLDFQLRRSFVARNLEFSEPPKSPKASISICNAIAPEASRLDFQLRRSFVARKLEFLRPRADTYIVSPKIAATCFVMEYKYNAALLATKYRGKTNHFVSIPYSNVAPSIASNAYQLEFRLKKALLSRAFRKESHERCHIYSKVSPILAPICKTMEYKCSRALVYKTLKTKSTNSGSFQLAMSIAPAAARLDYLLKKALLIKAMKSMKARNERSGSQIHETIRDGVERIERQMTRDALRQSLDRRPTREEIEETGVLNSITRGG